MKAVSIFSGAGGLDYGFEAAGFQSRVCVDFDAEACATLRANRAWPVIQADVMELPAEDILRAAALEPGETDVLLGGPPCQPFSKSGYWWRGDALRLEDPRAGTLGRYLTIIRELRPRVVLFENVDAVGYEGKDEGLQLLVDGLKAINVLTGTRYEPTIGLIDAADYGVPQHRTRLFLVAARDGRIFRFPNPSHSREDLLSGQTKREAFSTAWDAIGDLDSLSNEAGLELTGKWAQLLPSIPEGRNYLWHTSRGGGKPLFGWRTRFWSFLLKLAKDQPSWTIQAQPGPATGPFHWSNRLLSARELCRLQTFPDDVTIVGDRRSAQKQLGNAVPSLLAEVLARAIRSQLLNAPLADLPPRLLPTKRRPIPDPEKVALVPESYHFLSGKHAAHPGTGKGPSAVGRRTSIS
ncbi:MAG TPA: DNA cytosine methyltransferase [Stellaceae bacterium]|nr:DNA cytosine methyltransferase [Stellaceae bacterium]